MYGFFFFFFFQAEDGIRDVAVTGVQTCALPISTRTDTEVLLQAYRHWGEGCLARLDGMFAFAIWDGARGRLFCARDRLGIKPFYYAMPAGAFVFASEIKALLAFPGVDATPDDEAVVAFLAHANCDYGERDRKSTRLNSSHGYIS